VESGTYRCEGCGERLSPSDEVRAVYRELADEAVAAKPRWAYTHLGHEPQGRAYRIIGRGPLAELEAERKNKDT
jgi:tRNA(Ile2) C34 agmatinyltransferase TiaS